MKTTKTLLLGLFLILASTSFSFAQANGAKQKNFGQPGVINVIPDLTDAQKEKIQTYHTSMIKNSTEYRADIDIKEAELNKLMVTGADLSKKEAKLKEISDLKLKMQIERMRYHENVRSVLTDDQKVVFDNWALNHQRGPQNFGSNGKGDGRMGMHGRGNGPQGDGQGMGPCGQGNRSGKYQQNSPNQPQNNQN